MLLDVKKKTEPQERKAELNCDGTFSHYQSGVEQPPPAVTKTGTFYTSTALVTIIFDDIINQMNATWTAHAAKNGWRDQPNTKIKLLIHLSSCFCPN